MIRWPHANRSLPTTTTIHPSTPIPAKLIWWQSGSWLITLVNIFHFRSLSQMTTGCHWLKAIFLKGGAFAKYQMKMIPLSAWVSLSVGALLIGLEYIAAAVVTAASNISPLLRLSSSARSTFRATAYCEWSSVGAPAPIPRRSSEWRVANVKWAWFRPKLVNASRVLMCPEGLAVLANCTHTHTYSRAWLCKLKPTIVSPTPHALCYQAQGCWHWLVKVIYCNEICHMQAYGLIIALFVNIFSKETNRQLKWEGSTGGAVAKRVQHPPPPPPKR